MGRVWLSTGLLGASISLLGCSGVGKHVPTSDRPEPRVAQLPAHGVSPPLFPSDDLPEGMIVHWKPTTANAPTIATTQPGEQPSIPSHRQPPVTAATLNPATVSLVTLEQPVRSSNQSMHSPPQADSSSTSLPTLETNFASLGNEQRYPLNLPTALAMVGGQHPAVGYAQWRVQEAYARVSQAQVMWLPSLRAGFSFYRHDGNLQASDGQILDVNRNSFQYGLGSGAVGAGTTQRPGLIAQFHLKDALFAPRIAERTAWARTHQASGVYQRQLLDVSLAYLELLRAQTDLEILHESRQRTADLAKLTEDFAATGHGLRADAERMATQLALLESRIAAASEASEVASWRLAQALSLDTRQLIVPLDPTVAPIHLVSLDNDKSQLVATGLSRRPELKSAEALVAVACERYRREKYSPLVPSVLLGMSTTGFGGGVGSDIRNVDGRYDFDAAMNWELRNLGWGENAARRAVSSQVQQAKFQKIRLLDQVAQEICEAHCQAVHRAQRIDLAERAIQSAQSSYQRNLSRIRDAKGLPIEALQSIIALEDSRRDYLQAVAGYNEAQFRLQWALGWPVSDAMDESPSSEVLQ